MLCVVFIFAVVVTIGVSLVAVVVDVAVATAFEVGAGGHNNIKSQVRLGKNCYVQAAWCCGSSIMIMTRAVACGPWCCCCCLFDVVVC